jgi:hypothetical protein
MSKSNSRKYVRVALYDAEKKKNIGKTISRDSFTSEKAMNNYIDKLKEVQREKNKKVKENVHEETRDKIQRISNKPLTNINNFILDKNTGNSTVILGSSKRGKTTLMMKLYGQFYADVNDNIATLFSGNHHIDAYKNYKNLLVGNGFNEQSEKFIKMEKYINSKCKNKYEFLNLFDDIIDLKYKKLVNNLILTYRNSNISTIMCLQYGFLLSKMNRANVNNIIIFGCNSAESKKDLIELYLKPYLINEGYSSYRDQVNYFDEVTSNYGFFYINNVKNIMTIHRLSY